MMAGMVVIRIITMHAQKPHSVIWTRIEAVSTVFDVICDDGKGEEPCG